MNVELFEITTDECAVCRKSSTVTVDKAAHQRWRGGELIQRAFPTWTDDQRELLITGTHPECWDTMFEGVE